MQIKICRSSRALDVLMDNNAFSYLLILLQNSFSPVSRDHWMILSCFFPPNFKSYILAISETKKKNRKIGPLKVYSNLKVIPLKLFYYQTFLKLGVMNIHGMNIIKMQ